MSMTEYKESAMTKAIRSALLLVFTAVTLVACSSNPYNDPDSQRERSKDAQDEMRRDTSRY
jgi:hypothetical protein